jgi:hypothetical protein
MSRKYLRLLAVGALIMSMSFILKHYNTLTDTTDGLLKGFAIGLMILSLILSLKQLKLKR